MRKITAIGMIAKIFRNLQDIIPIALVSVFFVSGLLSPGVVTNVNAAIQDDGNVTISLAKTFVASNQSGDAVLKNITTTFDGKYANTKVEVSVPEDGKYYVTAWVMGTNGTNKIPAYLDGDSNSIGYLKILKNEWHCAELQSKNAFNSIQLSKGTHVFTFRNKDIPAIEFIRLAQLKGGATISDTNYQKYIKTLETTSLPKSYAQSKISNQATGALVSPATSNPAGDYAYQLSTSFSYTYYGYFYFTSGQHVVFNTNRSDPWASDPVMYLFNTNDPVNGGSWSNDDYYGLQPRIDVTIPGSGDYILLLRSYSSSPGTTNLYKDGSLYASNVPLSGTNVYCGDISKTGTLNYFTCKLTGDSRIWLQDSSSWPGLVKGYNDDYAGSREYSWGLASRVKKDISPSINYVLVSNYGSNNPIGTADVYMKCDNSDIMSYFENLKADDAIKSAPATGSPANGYNCISWSGGITNSWSWPPSPSSPWYNSNALTAFDNFYGNTPSRYSGAWNYSRSGATESNSVIDLWATSSSYTHTSVTKPGNDQAHGYDWESKPGEVMRTFHPRYALRGTTYGNVVAYYKPTGTYMSATSSQTTAAMTLEDAVKSGSTVVEHVELAPEEQVKLANSVNTTPEKARKEFEIKYSAWKATWDEPNLAIQSNPDMYTQSAQYKEFLAYCESQGKAVWPLLFQKYEKGDERTKALVEKSLVDLTYQEYSSLLDNIREESKKERYNDKGAYIVPSEEANTQKYIKKLLILV